MSSTEALLKNLPIETLQASSTNPRQHFDRAGLDELKSSIAASGIQVPLLVRPRTPDAGADGVFAAGEPEYEVVTGERRLRAAEELGLEDLPCLVREMSDAEARETQIIENLQRAGVHPLEEAEAFGELLGRLGSIPAVAAKLGKEQSYVAKCLRLRSLTLCSTDALRGKLITIDHALLLARLAETEQNEALKWTLDRTAGSKKPVEKVIDERLARLKKDEYMDYIWEPRSVPRLKSHIEHEGGVKLSRAPWDLDHDTLLPDVGPCSQCEKNTKANAPLFGDLDIGDPTCTDGACFQEKTDAFVHVEMLKAGLDAKAKKLIPRLSWKASSVKPSIVPDDLSAAGGPATANPAKILKQGQWIEAKKGSCANARPGVTADWSRGQGDYMGCSETLRKPGETLQVCIAVGCKAHKKEYEKPESANSNHAERPDPAEKKRKREEGEFLEKMEPRIRAKVFTAILGKLNAAQAIQLLADNQRDAPAVRKEILAGFPGAGGELLEALTLFYCEFRQYLRTNSYWLMRPGGIAEGRKELWKLAKQVGVDANLVAAQYFHEAGSIAPAADKLYPKGVPWPKGVGHAAAPAKAAKQIAAGSDKKKIVAKKGVRSKPAKLSAKGRERIAAAMKKRWAALPKAAKKGVKA